MLDDRLFPDDPGGIRFVDWFEVWDRVAAVALVDRLVIPGRWTSIVGPPKAGKSTLLIHLAVSLARGRNPLTDEPTQSVPVVYLDKEMGRIDIIERLKALEVSPSDLGQLHYADTDIPFGDALQGGTEIVSKARICGARMVILDGINGFFDGDENDNEPWRQLFAHTIQPLKQAGIAVVTSHNQGHDSKRPSRGSSVQLDKPDAVIQLKKSADGLILDGRLSRTSELLSGEMRLTSQGLDGSAPISFAELARPLPTGTIDLVAKLDELDVPRDATRDVARGALKATGVKANNVVLGAALKLRREK